MTFLTFGPADFFDGHRVAVARIQLAVEFGVDAVKFIPCLDVGAVGEIDLRGSVTIDAPTHAQLGKLIYLVHLLYRTVTGLTLYFTGMNMLGMAEEYMIRQVMNLYPFHRLTFPRIFSFFRIIAGMTEQFLYLFIGVHPASI